VSCRLPVTVLYWNVPFVFVQKYVVDKRYRLPNVCPLCNKLRTNDTALSVSGLVPHLLLIPSLTSRKKICKAYNYRTRFTFTNAKRNAKDAVENA